jgi:hypothetical protein
LIFIYFVFFDDYYLFCDFKYGTIKNRNTSENILDTKKMEQQNNDHIIVLNMSKPGVISEQLFIGQKNEGDRKFVLTNYKGKKSHTLAVLDMGVAKDIVFEFPENQLNFPLNPRLWSQAEGKYIDLPEDIANYTNPSVKASISHNATIGSHFQKNIEEVENLIAKLGKENAVSMTGWELSKASGPVWEVYVSISSLPAEQNFNFNVDLYQQEPKCDPIPIAPTNNISADTFVTCVAIPVLSSASKGKIARFSWNCKQLVLASQSAKKSSKRCLVVREEEDDDEPAVKHQKQDHQSETVTTTAPQEQLFQEQTTMAATMTETQTQIQEPTTTAEMQNEHEHVSGGDNQVSEPKKRKRNLQ